MEDNVKTIINVAGDYVQSKHVDYEINNVEAGGIGIQFVNGKKTSMNPAISSPVKPKLKKTVQKHNTSVPYTIRYINKNEQSRNKRLQIMMLCLQNLRWIEEPKSADDFTDLFDGAPRECNIKWTNTLNQATIYYLLQQLLAQPYIEKVTGCSARSLMKNQFHFSNPRADEKRITPDNKKIVAQLLRIIDPQIPLPTKSEDFTDDVTDMNSTYRNYLEDGLHARKGING